MCLGFYLFIYLNIFKILLILYCRLLILKITIFVYLLYFVLNIAAIINNMPLL